MYDTVKQNANNGKMHMFILHGEKPSQPPAMDSIIVKVPGSYGDSMLVCDIWKCGDNIVAKPVATLMPTEVTTCGIWATMVSEITHKHTMLNQVIINSSFPMEVFRNSKEVPPECIL